MGEKVKCLVPQCLTGQNLYMLEQQIDKKAVGEGTDDAPLRLSPVKLRKVWPSGCRANVKNAALMAMSTI